VRERRGDPGVVPSFRCTFLPGMSSSMTPESPSVAPAQFLRRRRWPSPILQGLGTLDYPTPIRFRWDPHFGAVSSPLLRPAELLASLGGPDRLAPADRDVYVRASGGLVTLPAAGYDYGGNWASSTGGAFTRWNGS